MASVETAEDLYGLALERFIPERTALAKALRAAKRRDEAAEVGARRKPSVAAWAVNQLVRTQGKTVAALFEAGDDLADAQAGAAEGKKTAERMRAAMRRQRDVIETLVEAARGLLSQDGHPLSTQTLERVTDTLRAASIDPEAREQVRDGCLTQELRFVGLGLGLEPGLGRRAAPPPAKTTRERKECAEQERQEQLRAARRVEREARRATARAEKELQAATQQRDAARAALQEAEDRLEDAAATEDRAKNELKEAETEVARLNPSAKG